MVESNEKLSCKNNILMYFDSFMLRLMWASKEKHSKSICFVSYVTIHNRPQSTTGMLRSIIPAMPMFQLTIAVILCPSNTVKSFCNAWHVLHFTFYLHLKFHCRCLGSVPIQMRSDEWMRLRQLLCVSYPPIRFSPGVMHSVLSRWCWMFESCQILLAEFHFSTEKYSYSAISQRTYI